MYVKKMSQAIRGADRWRERTKQTTAFPNERLRRRRSVRWGSLGCEWKKSREPSMFRAEAPGLGLFLMSLLGFFDNVSVSTTIELLNG